jgi:hypothetical protein
MLLKKLPNFNKCCVKRHLFSYIMGLIISVVIYFNIGNFIVENNSSFRYTVL